MKRLAIVALVALVAACTGEAEDTTTTTTGSTTTSEATTTSTEPTTTTAPYADHVVVYVLDTTGSNGSRQPPFLYPISVAPLGGSTELEAAVETLVAITGFDSAIPSGTTVDSVSQTGAIVEVDLSDDFEDDAVGSASVFARLARLTFTLT
ncbi:MAG: GerMN domain-containing protein, partial [Acidimicrobiia bacterium]|nr:GerMN domain-containing protein [Acidimicrobiia bacterium]